MMFSDYELLRICVNEQKPEGGFNVEEMIRRMRILNKLDEIKSEFVKAYAIDNDSYKLVDSATFNYALIYKDPEIVYTLNPVPVVQGTLVMTGTEYETHWETNDQAWNWTAKKLNLTFTSTSTTTTTTII